jgi:hypothetical protein
VAENVEIGNVGGGGVASEITLMRLVSATEAMAKKAGIDPKDVTKKLKALSTATEDTIKISSKNRDALKNNTKEVNKAASAAKNFSKGLAGAIASIIGTLTGSVVGLTRSILIGDNRISDFAKHLPGVGEIAAELTGILDNSVDSFKAMAMSGASFNHSIGQMRMAAVNSHMSLEDFTSMVVQNSDKLAGLGGTVTQGALFLSKMNKGLGQTRLDLMNLGLSTADVNEALLDYAHLTRAGGRQRSRDDKTAAEQGQVAARYTKSLLTLSKLTGEDVKSLQEKNAAAQQSLAFQMKLATLDKDQREKINKDLAIVTALGGAAMTQAFQAEFLNMPPMTRAAQQFVALNTDGYALVQKSVADALSASVSIETNAANAGALQVGILQSQFDMAKNLSTQLSMQGAGGDAGLEFDAMFVGKGELLASFINEQGQLNVAAAAMAMQTAQDASDASKTIIDPVIEAANQLKITAAKVQIELEKSVKIPLINAAAGAVKAITDQIAKIPDSKLFTDAMATAKTSIESMGTALDTLVNDLSEKGLAKTTMDTMLAGATAFWKETSGWQKAMIIGAGLLFTPLGSVALAMAAGIGSMFKLLGFGKTATKVAAAAATATAATTAATAATAANALKPTVGRAPAGAVDIDGKKIGGQFTKLDGPAAKAAAKKTAVRLAAQGLKFIPGVGLIVVGGMAAFDGAGGYNADPDAGFGEKMGNAGSSMLNGLTLGMLGSSPEEIAASAAEKGNAGTKPAGTDAALMLSEAQVSRMERVAAISFDDFNQGITRLNPNKLSRIADINFTAFATGLKTFSEIAGLKDQFENLALANTVDLSDFNKGLKRLDVSQLGYLASTDLSVFSDGLKTFAEIPNLQTQFDAVNSLDTDGVISYTSAMEKLVIALNNVNDELAKDNNGMFSAGTGTNAGDMINSVSGLNNGGSAGSEQLNSTLGLVLNELRLIKGFEETTAKNTKNMSGNIALGGVIN